MRVPVVVYMSSLLIAGAVYASDVEATKISSEEALAQLRTGNGRFVSGHSNHPHCDQKRLIETDEKGQHPFATIVSCSDSRVPVEILFDEGLGDLFVIRVAGNVCDVDETGSVEYGVAHLGTPLLVVLGHSSCGAVTAVATDAELHGNIPQLVDNIKPAVVKAQEEHPDLHGKDIVPAAVRANVWQSMEDLLRISPETRELIASGKLMVVGAIYDLHSGKVEWMGPHPKQKELLTHSEKTSHGADAGKHGEKTTVSDSRHNGTLWMAIASCSLVAGLLIVGLKLKSNAS